MKFFRFQILAFFLFFGLNSFAAQGKESVIIHLPENSSQRIEFGANELKKMLNQKEIEVFIATYKQVKAKNKKERYTLKNARHIFLILEQKTIDGLKKEGFRLEENDNQIFLTGADASGVLYGCLELAERIATEGALPKHLNFTDAPKMVLRGQCIGLQKPFYLPGRNVYEYPYTPETFPWFYDKQLWIKVLDSMVHNRMNSLYLWNGHPFASLVKLKEYPYALEVDDATFKKNEEIYSFLTTEADKRGIWVIQMFYNIIISKPFADKNGLKTQERERPIIPIIADYTQKSIAAFVEKYPNVGLLVTLGEAMEGVGQDDIDWFTKTIIPGVKDGLKALGKTDEPPIVLRAHDTDAPSVMKEALPLYKNLYTMAKFNGEALTYETPRGTWAQLHRTLSSQGNVHIANVHILANLEPFRYGATDFIQRSVQGMENVLDAHGLHLYPESSFWDWPYSADSVRGGKRLLQIERDWLWYKSWSRYAWNSTRDYKEEDKYWAKQLATQFGTNEAIGYEILKSYQESGHIAPKLLRRFGITDGNRQTLTLGMLMTQLINPYRYGLFTLLYESEAPEGESLAEYAEKDWTGKQHVGETPMTVINEVKAHADKAIGAIDKAAKNVTKNNDEFERVKNDVYAYHALAYHYAKKAEAALYVLSYKYSDDIKNLDKALQLLRESVADYQRLVKLTKGTYLYANSMQTQQRKIPMRGVDATYKTWAEVFVPFQMELKIFEQRIDSLKNSKGTSIQKINSLQNAIVKLKGGHSNFVIDSLQQVFADTNFTIRSFAPELKGLRGVKLSFKKQIAEGTSISFTNSKPIKVLVGFFEPQKAAFTKDTVFLKAPELETNALANDYGQADTKIANAIVLPGMPQLHVHTYDFGAGNNILKLEKGVALILGFINADAPLKIYDAALYESGNRKNVDWLFE